MSLITITNDTPWVTVITLFAAGVSVSAGLVVGGFLVALAWKSHRQVLGGAAHLAGFLWKRSSRFCVALYRLRESESESEKHVEEDGLPKNSRWAAFDEPTFLRGMKSHPYAGDDV